LIDQVKKENFSLKLKIFFLEERLAKLAPDHIDSALKENIELKVDFQTLQQELKKHKRMCLDLNKVVGSLQTDLEAAQDAAQNTSHVSSSSRERDLERAHRFPRTRTPLQRTKRGHVGQSRDERAMTVCTTTSLATCTFFVSTSREALPLDHVSHHVHRRG
jgi:hypothetical protein